MSLFYQEYVSGLEDAMATACKAHQTMDGKVPLVVLRQCIQGYEPTKALEEVDNYVARGAQLGAIADVEAQVQLGMTVELGIFISRLKTGLVKRGDNYIANAAVEYATKVKEEGQVSGVKSLDHPQLA